MLGEAGKRFEHFLPLGNPFPKESTCQNTANQCLGFVISMGTHQLIDKLIYLQITPKNIFTNNRYDQTYCSAQYHYVAQYHCNAQDQ